MRHVKSVHYRSLSALIWLLAVGVLMLLPVRGAAQSATAGDVAGTITDQQQAAIPSATITLTNTATGVTRSVTADERGSYRFSLLAPGDYRLSAAATGFQPQQTMLAVSPGEVSNGNLRLTVGPSTQTVTVTAEAAPVQIRSGDISTGFSGLMVGNVPNGGGDLTSVVQATPGAVMNTQAGYGNFATFGLPATSNLFTINGMEDNDPFFNLNNSGATNLMLGQNSMQQVTVVNNGYSGQYGELGGAHVNYVTKSGSNAWHGNAIYNWNGRVMNANNFFNNALGSPRPFNNANQWAASFGGYMVPDKTFFFVDTEGLNVVLPTNLNTKIPTPEFQAATLANLTASGQADQVPFYQSMFDLYNNAPGAANASVVPGGGCGTFTGLFGAPCALQFQSTAGNHTHEWQLSGRVDQVIGNSDHMFLQLETDQGNQASITDAINPGFNITSDQPQYTGQWNWTHSFGAAAVNQLVASASHYEAIFGANPAARSALMPMTVLIAGNLFNRLGGYNYDFPQGRNVAQYGVSDDYTVTHGMQTMKAGVNYRLNYVNDYDFGRFTTARVITSLGSFYNGLADTSQQTFPVALNQPARMYSLGGYLEDDIAVTPGLHFTLAIRAEHNSNPICAHSCIARLNAPFSAISHDANIPYNQVISTGLRTTLPDYEKVLWSPRAGFAWTPFADQKTVLRGGFGLFYDNFPAMVFDNFAANAPQSNSFVVNGPLSPDAAGNVLDLASADNQSFLAAFNAGETLASITAANTGFIPPDFYSSDQKVKSPRYQEWNLELQQQFGADSAVSINYVGNHGVHEPIQNQGVNAYAAGFTGLPATAPDPRFGVVTQLTTGGISSYNGMTVSFKRRFSDSLQLQANYTWSHALDEVSNGGFLPYNFATNIGFLGVQDPYNIRAYNYGNADYDVRHNFSMHYVWTLPFRDAFSWGPDQLWRGWTLSGTIFTRSGLPLTVVDGNATTYLGANNYGAHSWVFANLLGSGQNGVCTVDKQCLTPSAFSPSTSIPTGFGNQMRNQFRGPRFFNTDLSVVKNTQVPGWEQGQLGLGIQFFNLFNHPNFDQPVNDTASSQFGTVLNTVSVPTSILGSFLGGDAAPRVIQLHAKITF